MSVLFFILALIITVIILTAVHEWGHFIAARWCGVKIEKAYIGFGRPLIKKTSLKTKTEYAIGCLPFGGFVQLYENNDINDDNKKYNLAAQPLKNKLTIALMGPLFSILFAIPLLTSAWMLGIPAFDAKITSPPENSIAAFSGFQNGDVITAVDGNNVATWLDTVMQIFLFINDGKTVEIDIKRNHESFTLALPLDTSILQSKTSFMQTIGLNVDSGTIESPSVKIRQLNFIDAGQTALKQGILSVKLTFKTLYKIVTGQLSLSNLSGPIGIGYQAGLALSSGVGLYLFFLAIVSINLGFINLLPLPILDGGQCIRFIIEKIRGKPVSARWRYLLQQLTIGALICLLAFTIESDTKRIIQNQTTEN